MAQTKKRTGRKARWGSIKLKGRRWQASYPDPTQPGTRARIYGPMTYERREDAEAWLAGEHALLAREQWTHPDERARAAATAAEEAARGQVSFKTYAEQWIATRTNRHGSPLASRTREEYERYLDDRLAPWAETPLARITPEGVRAWYAEQIADGKKTSVGRQYDFMKSVLKTAVEDNLIHRNPCTVKGGSKASTELTVTAPTDAELQTIIDAMPKDLQHVVLIAASAGLRWGEIAVLTPEDVEINTDPETGDVDKVRIHVKAAEVRLKGGKKEIKEPKSRAGTRIVDFYGRDARDVAAHVRTIKPGERLTTRTYAGVRYHWKKARAQAGREDLHFHALRHYQGTRFAQQGATLAEIMARLGHSDVKSAMAYQEAAQERMEELARRSAR